MRYVGRVVARSAVALLLIGGIASPGAAASAAPHPQQWWFDTWRVENGLWPLSKGEGVTVAVLDSGVQASLSGLSGSILPGADFESGRGDGRRDVDQDEQGHGTGMASLIVSQGSPTGFLGVAPEAKILPVVVRSPSTYSKGIRFAVDRGAKVINMSLGIPGYCPPDLQDAVSSAIKRDAIVVASAGNSGHEANETQFPSNCKGVLAVGGAGPNLRPFAKTQRQPYVAVAAPATRVGSVLRDGQFYTSEGGTSSASALASGAIALIRSKFPQMSNREVVRQVIASATDIAPKGRDNATGAGMFQPRRVLQGAIPKNTANPVFEEYDRLAAEEGEESPGTSSSGPGANMGNVIGLGAMGAVALVVVVVLFFVNRRRRPAAVGPMQGGMMPPNFGAPQQPPYPGSQHAPVPPQGGPPYPPAQQAQQPQQPQQPHQALPGQPPYPPQHQQGPPPHGGGGYPQ